MTRPPVAFLLSLVVPGLGLLYLGKRAAAALNLALAVAIPLLVLWIWPSKALDFLHYVLLAIAAGSAGAAHGASLADAKKKQRQATLDAPRA